MMITNDKNLFKVPETVTAVEKTFGNPSAKSVQFPIIHVKLIPLYQLFFTQLLRPDTPGLVDPGKRNYYFEVADAANDESNSIKDPPDSPDK